MRKVINMNCPICGKTMVGTEIFEFPKRYVCSDNHCFCTIDSRNVIQWYDCNGRNFTPPPSDDTEKDVEYVEKELEKRFNKKH